MDVAVVTAWITYARRVALEESLALRVVAGWRPRAAVLRRGACHGLPLGTDVHHLCPACPARLDCLATVMADEAHLHRGDITGYAAVGHQVRRRHRLPRPREHGTAAGYQAHHRAGETACDQCKATHAATRALNKARQVAA